MSGSDVIHRAIGWLVSALSVGTTSEEVNARVAPTLTERGDFVAYVNSSPRFAPWRSHRPEVEAVEIAPGGLGAVATVRTGPGRWELDAAIEARDPHRIRRVVVRPVPDDGVEWSAILTQVAAPDRWELGTGQRAGG